MCHNEQKDYGTPELHRQRGVTVNRGVHKAAAQTSLDYLHDRAIISDEQYYAAGDLLMAFRASGITDKLGYRTGCYSEDSGGGLGLGHEENELIYWEAISSVDPHERRAVRNVVCYDRWIDTRKQPDGLLKYESAREIVLLRKGLDDLIKHWATVERTYEK